MAVRSSRLWKVLAIFVAVWAIVLIGLDRGGKYLAEYEAAKTIQDSQHLASRPDVELSGIPFLTQLIAGEFDDVTLDAQGVIVHPRGRDLRLSTMHVDLHHVSVSRSFDSFHIDTADATAVITYADLGNTVGATLAYDGNGHLTGMKSVTVPVLGNVSAAVSLQPTLNVGTQSLHFNDVQFHNVPALAQPLVSKVFQHDLPLTDIPFGLRIESLKVDQGGVHLQLHGTDISYSR